MKWIKSTVLIAFLCVLSACGNGLSHYTSHDMKHWTGCRQGVITDIPQWTRDSVPGFTQHVQCFISWDV